MKVDREEWRGGGGKDREERRGGGEERGEGREGRGERGDGGEGRGQGRRGEERREEAWKLLCIHVTWHIYICGMNVVVSLWAGIG